MVKSMNLLSSMWVIKGKRSTSAGVHPAKKSGKKEVSNRSFSLWKDEHTCRCCLPWHQRLFSWSGLQKPCLRRCLKAGRASCWGLLRLWQRRPSGLVILSGCLGPCWIVIWDSDGNGRKQRADLPKERDAAAEKLWTMIQARPIRHATRAFFLGFSPGHSERIDSESVRQ